MKTDIQRLLILICTNSSLRQEFFADRNGFCIAQQIIDPEEQNFFRSLQESQIRFFADALLRKRFHVIRTLLPVTFTFFNEKEAWNRFCEFASGFTPAGIYKHQHDAVGFADYLLRLPESQQKNLREVLRYERNEINDYTRPPFFRISFYRCTVLNHDSENGTAWEKNQGLFLRIKNRVFRLISIS